MKRDGDKATVACNFTTQTWHIVCQHDSWFGSIDNCTVGRCAGSVSRTTRYNDGVRGAKSVTFKSCHGVRFLKTTYDSLTLPFNSSAGVKDVFVWSTETQAPRLFVCTMQLFLLTCLLTFLTGIDG